MAHDRSKQVKIGDKKYTMRSDDDYLDYVSSDFEPEMVKVFKSLIKKDFTVLDVGANIGCTALLFGEVAEKVFAFEPSTTTSKYLKENISASGLRNVEVFEFGLGDKEFTSTLSMSASNRAGAFVSNATKASARHVSESIAIKTLDRFVMDHLLSRLDFIKIDVEGFERHVLIGGQNAIAKYRPVVVVELNHWCLNAFQRITVPEFFDFLMSMFPIVYAYDKKEYKNVFDTSERFEIMYQHIVERRFPNLVAAFDQSQLESFMKIMN